MYKERTEISGTAARTKDYKTHLIVNLPNVETLIGLSKSAVRVIVFIIASFFLGVPVERELDRCVLPFSFSLNCLKKSARKRIRRRRKDSFQSCHEALPIQESKSCR